MKRVCMINEDDFDSCIESISNMVVMINIYINMIMNDNLSLDDIIGKLSKMRSDLQEVEIQMTKYEE